MNDTWVFEFSFSASHLFFELGIAWVWVLSLLLGPCSFLSYVCGLLVLLPCHCTASTMISLILLPIFTSGLTDWSAYHAHFLYYSFFWTFLPNILAGLAHSMPWASPTHFILWASSAHFILPYLFHTHEFFAKSFGLSRLNHHIFTFRTYWPLC